MLHRRSLWAFFLTLALILSLPGLPVRAQDGDSALLPYNEPLVVPLTPGQAASVAFLVVPGDSFDVRLTPLGAYSYSATLVDPDQTPLPLPINETNDVFFPLDTALLGGVYTLLIEATSGGGDMLVLVSSTSQPPQDLSLGETPVDLATDAGRFRLAAPPETGPTRLEISGVSETPDVPAMAPGFTLIDTTLGTVVMTVAPGALPDVSLALPVGEYILALDAGPDDTVPPPRALINWTASGAPVEPAVPGSIPTPTAPSSSSGTSGTSGSSGSSSTGTCQVALSGGVNVRQGPGVNYPIITVAGAGAVLNVIGQNSLGDWYQVSINGQVGWLSNLLTRVTIQGDCSSVPQASAPAPPSAPPSSSGGSTAVPTPTPIGGSATASPAASYTPSVTYTPSATYTPGGPTLTPTNTYTPSYTPTMAPPTATYTLTYTPPPLADQVAPTFTPSYTPTVAPPTATYTPSYTPTTPPPAQVAPPDANFNAPLNIPLDTTASVTDFVSYPGGDTEDRVRWDISGMNPNVALSGGRARLVIAVSCFGTGTANVSFFVGGQTFSCGQTLVDREVTYDSRTGQVTITATGGESTYVQWVLTGTATRLN